MNLMDFVQFGLAPEKKLAPLTRTKIAALLQRDVATLEPLFAALEQIMTAHSPQAKPLVSPPRVKKARADLRVLIGACDALRHAIKDADEQVRLRIALGSTFHAKGETPIGDFGEQLVRFRSLCESIDDAIAPARGGRTRVDRLRVIVYFCALQYRSATGQWPARRTGGVFHRMMNLVLSEIGLKLPVDPARNILKPAIDQAIEHSHS